MKASGVVETLEQMRKISAASVELVTYYPTETNE